MPEIDVIDAALREQIRNLDEETKGRLHRLLSQELANGSEIARLRVELERKMKELREMVEL